MQTTNTNSEISIAQADIIKKAWMNCLPGNLSNLFYYLDENGVHRFDNYFELAQDGVNMISDLESTIHCVRIYMGCEENESSNVFSPVLSLVTSTKEYYYRLVYVVKNESDGAVQTDVNINPAIADLFQINWDELNDAEMANAFSGVTYSDKSGGIESTPPAIRRVKFYDFPDEDVSLIVNKLREYKLNNEAPRLLLLLGAGLTVRLTHPFNFRPIIAVFSLPTTSGELTTTHNIPGATYFERSRPCPPFCNDKEES